METERTWKCNARTYTESEVRESGFNHGQNGITYYPPHRWGTEAHEPSRGAPNWAEKAYDGGYASGKAASYLGIRS